MSNKKRKQDVAYNDFYELSEKDFYPPSDDRIITLPLYMSAFI